MDGGTERLDREVVTLPSSHEARTELRFGEVGEPLSRLLLGAPRDVPEPLLAVVPRRTASLRRAHGTRQLAPEGLLGDDDLAARVASGVGQDGERAEVAARDDTEGEVLDDRKRDGATAPQPHVQRGLRAGHGADENREGRMTRLPLDSDVDRRRASGGIRARPAAVAFRLGPIALPAEEVAPPLAAELGRRPEIEPAVAVCTWRTPCAWLTLACWMFML